MEKGQSSAAATEGTEADEGPFSLAHVLFDELEQIRSRRLILAQAPQQEQSPKPLAQGPANEITPSLSPTSPHRGDGAPQKQEEPPDRPDPKPANQSSATPDDVTKRTLQAYYEAAYQEGLSALCLSGGGIRSAAFAFGVLQALAEFGVLKRFDFLSTVSGGGYAGSFLTAWVQRSNYNIVTDKFKLTTPPTPDSPISYIRRYSRYLTPHSGILSADVLAVVALFSRNLFLNWLVIFPFVVATVLVIKLSTVAIWWIIQSPVLNNAPVFELLAIAFLGVAYVDSLRQRPGWESEKSEHLKFTRYELTPMSIGSLLAVIAASRFLHYSATPDWWKVFVNVVGTATATALTIWLVAYYFSHKTPRTERSTEITLEDSPAHAFLTALGFTISGAISASAAVALLCLFIKVAPYVNGEIFIVVFGPPLLLSCLFLGELVYTGLVSDTPWADGEREWLGRAAGYHGLIGAIYFLSTGLVLFGSPAIFIAYHQLTHYAPAILATAGGVSGILIAIVGKGPSTAALVQSSARSMTAASLEWLLSIATPIFIMSGVVLISAGIDCFSFEQGYLDAQRLSDNVVSSAWSAIAVGLLFGGSLTSRFVNINRFSLHNVYRNRLIRTFLGASNVHRAANVNKFTDFDERDNIRLCDIWPGKGFNNSPYAKRLKLQLPENPSPKPPPNLLVVNMALNVLATADLNLQERRALPFFATPRWIGSSSIGEDGSFRRAESYAEAMTLGTAMTISGAAASPNMGYHSSPSLGVLLTLLNVRLGAWLGNPGKEGDSTFKNTSPTLAAEPLLREALGLTNASDPYVYLSDGGHFENLGVYEMLRRRCRYILVSDAGCDPFFGFEDLGSLVRKARIDFGIEIRFRSPTDQTQKYAPYKGAFLAVADIVYPESETAANKRQGILLYLKPGVYGNEPTSVRSYWNLHPDFPHEPTTNQWFGESQFEAYRALGAYAVQSTLSGTDDIKKFFHSSISAVEAKLNQDT